MPRRRSRSQPRRILSTPASPTGQTTRFRRSSRAPLDNADKLKDIAANATAYSDDRIIELALREPTAIDFVQQLPTASKETSAYTGTVVKGTYPELYDWDTNWAFMDYGSLPLGLTGSGPTSLAMAYMGLTGKNDKSPADMAQLAINGGYATGASGTSADFFTSAASSLGLKVTKIDATENDIAENLTASTPILVELQAGTVGDESHWALLVSYNRDTSVTLYDPTSTSASAHSWDAGTMRTPRRRSMYSKQPTQQTAPRLRRLRRPRLRRISSRQQRYPRTRREPSGSLLCYVTNCF
jgi:hypothetical protein